MMPSLPRRRSVGHISCQYCGQGWRRPLDAATHECPILIARHARCSDNGLEIAPPSLLYRLSRGDGALYNHALREAGHIIKQATGEPEDPCSTCGWSPSCGPS